LVAYAVDAAVGPLAGAGHLRRVGLGDFLTARGLTVEA
jgi:hypothetical protein